MKILVVFLILVLGGQVHAAGKKAKKAVCAAAVARPEIAAVDHSGAVYLRLFQYGLDEKLLTPEDLRLALLAERPFNPMQGTFEFDKLSLSEAFDRAIAKIPAAEWPQIRARLNSAGKEIEEAEKARKESEIETRAIFSLQPMMDFPGKKTERAVRTSRGDVYLPFSEGGKTGVMEVKSGKTRMLVKGEHYWKTDIFETKSGDIYFAVTDDTQVKILNLRTGVVIFTAGWDQLPGIGDLVALNPGRPVQYRPILFEKSSGLHVALVPLELSLQVKRGGEIVSPLAIIDVKMKQVADELLREGKYHFTRSANGSVYAVGYEKNYQGKPNVLLLRDLGLQQDVVRQVIPRDLERERGFSFMSRDLRVITQEDQKPLMVSFGTPNEDVRIHEANRNAMISLPGLEMTGASRAQFFTGDDRKMWIAAVDSKENELGTVTVHRLVIRPVSGSQTGIDLPLHSMSPMNEMRNLKVIESLQGRLIIFLEQNIGAAQRLQIYNMSTQQLLSLPFPRFMGNVDLQEVFTDAATGNIFAQFISIDRDEAESVFLQVYGPVNQLR